MEISRQQKGFNRSKQVAKRWDDELKWVELDATWKSFRFASPEDKPGFIGYAMTHWITTKSGKRFPIYCKNFDPKTESWKKCGCVVCRDFDWNKADENTELGKKIKAMKPRVSVMTWAINRDKQEIGNVKGDKNWTPFDPIRFPQSLIQDIVRKSDAFKETVEVDGLKKKMSYDVTDEKHGRDVMISYNAKALPADKYSIQIQDKKPMSEEEQHYLKKLTPICDMIEYESEEEQVRSLTTNEYYGAVSVAQANDKAGVNEEDTDTEYKKSGFSASQTAKSADYDDIDVDKNGKVIQTSAQAPAAPAAPAQAAPSVSQAMAQTFAQDPSVKPAEPLAQAPVAPQAPAAAPQAPAQPADAIAAFATKNQTGTKVWQKGDLNGKTVPNCFSEYQGKTYCRSECPVKKACIDADEVSSL